MDIVQQIDDLRPAIAKLVELSGSPGLSLGVLHHGRILQTAHFGRRDVDRSDCPDDDTTYYIASLVKLLTAGSVASLVRDGVLEWDTPVHGYLPEFRRKDQIGEKATLRDLLSMRTGIAVSHATYGYMNGETVLPKSEVVRTASALPAVAPFRERFVYSQWNYGLVTAVVEAATGITFQAYVRKAMLDPLGMNRTTFDDVQGSSNVSVAHAVRNDGTANTIARPGWHDDTGFAGAGGCKSSLGDLLRMYQSFLRACADQDLSTTDDTVGSPWHSTRLLREPHIAVDKSLALDDLAYCLGLYKVRLPANMSRTSLNQQMLGGAKTSIPQVGTYNKDLVIYHSPAALVGYHASVSMVPSTQSAVVVVTNSLPLVDPTDFTAQLVLSVLLGEKPQTQKLIGLAKLARNAQPIGYQRLAAALEKKKTSVPPTYDLTAYEGDYYNALENIAYTITREDEQRLRMSAKGASRTFWDLLPYDGDTFYWPADREAELCEKAMWPFLSPDVHKVRFAASSEGSIDELSWFHDPGWKPEVFRKRRADKARM